MSGALLVALLLGASRPSVAVLSIGRDPADTGALQATIETRLRTLGELEVLPAERVAARLGTVSSWEGRPYDRERGAALLSATRRALAEDRRADAFLALAQLQALLDDSPDSPADDRIMAGLWRISALLSIGERVRARTEARTVLAIDPRLKVDTAVFRPSVASMVEEVRSAGLPEASVSVAGIPQGGLLQVDGKGEPESFRLVTGQHVFRLGADGFRPVSRIIQIDRDTSLLAGLPVAFPPRLLALLQRIMADPTRAPVASLEAIAKDLDVQVLAIVQPGRGPVLWRRGSGLLAGATGDEASTADWLEARLSDPPPHPRVSSLVFRAEELLAGGNGTVGWRTSLRTETMGGDRQSFWGGGPSLAAELSPAAWKGGLADLQLSWMDESVFPRPLSGGSTLLFQALGGWRTWLGSTESPRVLEVTALAGVRWEDLEAYSPADAEGGLFPSRRWSAVITELGLSVPLVVREQRGGVSLGLGMAPISFWDESPGGLSGGQPGPLGVADYRWEAGIWWEPRSTWSIRAGWEDEQVRVGYQGPASATVTPPLSDARREVDYRALTLSCSRAF